MHVAEDAHCHHMYQNGSFMVNITLDEPGHYPEPARLRFVTVNIISTKWYNTTELGKVSFCHI